MSLSQHAHDQRGGAARALYYSPGAPPSAAVCRAKWKYRVNTTWAESADMAS